MKNSPVTFRTSVNFQPTFRLVDLFVEQVSYTKSWNLPFNMINLVLEDNPEACAFRVTLYGSLAATGKGHFTDQAILDVLGAERTQIVWQENTVLPYHTNAMKFEALNDKGETAVQWTTYSVGGGS